MDRRTFLTQLILTGTLPFITLPTKAENLNSNKRFIFFMLRGGMDGMSLLPPFGIDEYYKYRPNISIPKSKLIKINDTFGLHPAFKNGMLSLYENNQLIFIPQSGQHNNSRSHFQAQDELEYGNSKIKSPDGFLNRMNQISKDFSHVSFTPAIPEIYKGSSVINNIAIGTYYTNINDYNKDTIKSNLSPNLINNYVKILENNSFFDNLLKKYPDFPNKPFTEKIGVFIKETNTNVSFIDTGHNWDTHAQYGLFDGKLFNYFTMLDSSIISLKKGLGTEWNNTTVVINTEFGRGIKENGSQGTEHGHGGLMIVTGGNVQKSQILGDIKSLKLEDAWENRDLHVEYEYREVLASLFKNHLNLSKDKIDFILPGVKHNLNIS